MVNNEIVKLIQDTVDDILDSTSQNYDSDLAGYECQVNNEINYQFEKALPNKSVANIVFGSATKNNDLEDKYSMSFVINIQSEAGGGEKAKKLFDDVFKLLTRTYPTLGNYNSKVFLASPVLIQPYYEIEDTFCCLYTMNGSVEFSEKIVLGSKYELSLDGTNYIEVKPRQPYCLKEATGGQDKNYSDPSKMIFTKESNVLTINLVILYEKIIKTTLTTEETNFNALFNKLLDEAYGETNQKYYLKDTTGTGNTAVVKTITNLVCVRCQKIYDEATGENVLSIQMKVGA